MGKPHRGGTNVKQVLTLALAALLVVSSTALALAQDPEPTVALIRAVDPRLTGDGSGYIVETTTSQLAAASSMAAFSCGAPEDHVIAWDTSNGAMPGADYNHASLIADLRAKGYIVATIDISTEGIPECVDTLVITSLSGNSCLTDYPAGSFPERNYGDGRQTLISNAVEQHGLALLLLGEHGLSAACPSSCGCGTMPIAEALGPDWLGNGANFDFNFTEGTHFFYDSPLSLFHNISSWGASKASTHSTYEGVVVKTLSAPPNNAIMIAKNYGSGCAVIVGDTGWASDWPFSDYNIARPGNRPLAHNVFEFLKTCPVVPENQPPVADANNPYFGTEGSPITLDGTGSYDPDDDPLTYAWTLSDGGTATGHSPSYTFADNGTYDVCLKVTDPGGLSDQDCVSAEIANVAPTVGPITIIGETVIGAGTTINASADFTDPGTADTHTAVWDWGDGSAAGTVTQGAGFGSVADSHTYGAAGIYEIQVTVTDKDGDSDESTFQHVIVYDRSEGFVTGSGKFDWPSDGASALGVGDTQFSVVAKYLKGDSVPTGGTSFVSEPRELDFESSSYEWLVITGGNYATLKGTGTINGEGNYQFRVWAGDGEPDTFTIRIWDEDEFGNEDLIYENDMDQPVTSGNIIIHDNVK